MKNVTLEQMTAQILEQLQSIGILPKRLKDYKYCGFGEIAKYFSAQSNAFYFTDMQDTYMMQVRKSAVWLEEFHISGLASKHFVDISLFSSHPRNAAVKIPVNHIGKY